MKPILFNTEMARAILADRKTVTRRVVKPRFCGSVFEMFTGRLCETTPEKPPRDNGDGTTTHFVRAYAPCKAPYRPGDILYVRETWRKDVTRYMYKADYSDSEEFYRDGKEVSIKWHPSIHMPREAARIFLRVTDVRAERLQNITDNGIVAEGIRQGLYPEKGTMKWRRYQLIDYVNLWNSTVKQADRAIYGWVANPWVWVIEFERISKEEAENEPEK